MNDLAICEDDTSPFDAIRHVDTDGSEWWSARELMTPLGYLRWERFADVIDRAIASAAATGHDVEQAFSRLREKGAGRMSLDLSAISAEFLNQCSICDLGIGSPCTCSSRDYRPTMRELVREVETLRALISEVAGKFEANAERQDAANRAGMLALARRMREAVES